ncbi:MAG: aminopeptidase, partial [Actinomycetota bacterium]|nr:aminopeptidase [Actinomycetota bacterium]
MTPDPARFAALLCGYCLDVQPGQQVVVRSTPLAGPLLAELQRELLERDAWPLFRLALPGMEEGFYRAARAAQLDAFAPSELTEAEETDCSLAIQAPENTRALAGIDPALIARAARARGPVREAVMRRRW